MDKNIFWTEKMIIYGKNILFSYINYVKKFEGHKPGREKRLENDPTIFRDRISFLMLIYTFYEFLCFHFFDNVIFQSQNSRKKFGFPFVS